MHSIHVCLKRRQNLHTLRRHRGTTATLKAKAKAEPWLWRPGSSCNWSCDSLLEADPFNRQPVLEHSLLRTKLRSSDAGRCWGRS